VNILGDADGSADDTRYVANLRDRAQLAAHWLSHARWTDGWESHG
jgi:5-(carboxyamino)imidazole ribonucleotide synthase